jgi:Na+/H+-dicarboxylate symporter
MATFSFIRSNIKEGFMFRSLSGRIFIGLFIGLLIGTFIQYGLAAWPNVQELFIQLADGIGLMFVHAIMLTVVPLVFFSIVTGVLELRDLSSFGRLGGRTFFAYLINTVIAISIATAAVMLIQPGAGLNLHGQGIHPDGMVKQLPNIFDLIVNIIPSNPIDAFASGNMLQVIFMAMLIGIVIKLLGEQVAGAPRFFQAGNQIMMKLIVLIMSFAPLGVCALMIKLGATLNPATFAGVIKYILLILCLLFFWLSCLYPYAVAILTGIPAQKFRQAIQEQFLFALSTASSNATIPVTMRTLTEKLGVSRAVAGFGVPLGATMNMGGVSIYMTVATLFVAHAYGAPISLDQLPTLLLNIFLLAVGSGGVPGGGLIMIGILITQLGLPLEAFALIAAVDRIIDMVVTSVNVVGDTAVVTIVDHQEKKHKTSA